MTGTGLTIHGTLLLWGLLLLIAAAVVTVCLVMHV